MSKTAQIGYLKMKNKEFPSDHKIQFEKDILDVLKKHGYKTEGVNKLQITLEVDELPIIFLTYNDFSVEAPLETEIPDWGWWD